MRWAWVGVLGLLMSFCLLSCADPTETYTYYVSASEKIPSANCTARNPCLSMADALSAFSWREEGDATFQVYISPGWYNGPDNVNITLPPFSRVERNNQTATTDEVVFEGDFIHDFGFSALSNFYLSEIKMIGFFQAIKVHSPPSTVTMDHVQVHSSSQSVYSEGGTLNLWNSEFVSGRVILNSSGSSSVVIINSTFTDMVDPIQLGTGFSSTNVTIADSFFNNIEQIQVDPKNSTLSITDTTIVSRVRSVLMEEVEPVLSISGGHVSIHNVTLLCPLSEVFSEGLIHSDGLSFRAENLTIAAFNISASVRAETIEITNSLFIADVVCTDLSAASIHVAGTEFALSQSTAIYVRPTVLQNIDLHVENCLFNNTGSLFYRYTEGEHSITGLVENCDFYEVRGSALDLTQGNWSIYNVQVHSIMDGNNLSPGFSYRAMDNAPGRTLFVSNSSVVSSRSRVSGAGMSAYGFDEMYLINSTFTHNNGSHGGAVHANGNYVEIINSYFANNRDSSEGGAVYISAPSFLVSGCVFENNTSLRGGDISVWTFYATNMTISNCNFTSSVSSAIYFHGDNSTLNLDRLTFRGASPYTIDCAPQTELHVVVSSPQSMNVDGATAKDPGEALIGLLCQVEGMDTSDSTEASTAATQPTQSTLIAFLSVIAVLAILLLLACLIIIWIRRDRNQHMDELLSHDEYLESFDGITFDKP